MMERHATELGIPGIERVERLDGSRGSAFRAVQTSSGLDVAIKLLDASKEPVLPRRFDRRRKILAQLARPDGGVVPLLTTGTLHNGLGYIVTPYYHGGSLADRLERGPMPWREAAEQLAEIAEIVGRAHDKDVVFGDLRPSGILLDEAGVPAVAAFGMATRRFDDGTPTYNAPESYDRHGLGPAADVYSLSAILAALVAGRPRARDEAMPAFLDELRGRLPEPIYDVIEHGLSASPTNRHGNARLMRRAIISAIEAVESGTTAPKAAPPTAPPHAPVEPASPAAAPAEAPPTPASAERAGGPDLGPLGEGAAESGPRPAPLEPPPSPSPASAQGAAGGVASGAVFPLDRQLQLGFEVADRLGHAKGSTEPAVATEPPNTGNGLPPGLEDIVLAEPSSRPATAGAGRLPDDATTLNGLTGIAIPLSDEPTSIDPAAPTPPSSDDGTNLVAVRADADGIPFRTVAPVRNGVEPRGWLARTRHWAELRWYRSRRTVTTAAAVLGLAGIAAIAVFFLAREFRSSGGTATDGVPLAPTTVETETGRSPPDGPLVTVTTDGDPAAGAPASSGAASGGGGPTATTAPTTTARGPTEAPDDDRGSAGETDDRGPSLAGEGDGHVSGDSGTVGGGGTSGTRPAETTAAVETTSSAQTSSTAGPSPTTGSADEDDGGNGDGDDQRMSSSPPTIASLRVTRLRSEQATLAYSSDQCVATRFVLSGGDGSTQEGSSRGYDPTLQCSRAWNLDFSGPTSLRPNTSYVLEIWVKAEGTNLTSQSSISFRTPA